METLRKVKHLVYGLVVIGGLLLPAQAWCTVTSMYASPSSQTVAVNDIFTLDLYLNNADATEFDTVLSWISFDPAVLEVQDADAGTGGIQIESDPLGIYGFNFHMANSADNTTGRIDLQESFSLGGTSTQTGIFARIDFKALALTSSTSIDFMFNPTWGLTPTTSVLRSGSDVLGSSSDHTDGTMGATAEVVPEPGSLVLLGSGLAGIFSTFTKKKRWWRK